MKLAKNAPGTVKAEAGAIDFSLTYGRLESKHDFISQL
jgi:hypothetical protein